MAEPIIMPKLGFDMAEGTLIAWRYRRPGDQQGHGHRGDRDRQSHHRGRNDREGTVLQLTPSRATVGAVGAPIGYVGAAGEAAPGDGADSCPAATAPAAELPRRPPRRAPRPPGCRTAAGGEDDHLPAGLKASPIARRLAEERGIDLRRVAGTVPGGRIVKKDIEDFPVGEAPAAPVAPAAAPAAPTAPAIPPQAARPTMPTFSDFRGRRGRGTHH